MVLNRDSHFSETKKLCKKVKVTPEPITVKHYKDGDFHKDYDRQLVTASIVNFMRDPTGDLPWEEDPVGADVYHVQDANVRNFHSGRLQKITLRPHRHWDDF